MILCLIFVAAIGEYSAAPCGRTEAWGASFSVRKRRWNTRGHLPTSRFCTSGSCLHATAQGNHLLSLQACEGRLYVFPAWLV